MNFSSQVKELKKLKNMNNETLAELSGVPFSTLNKILSNDDADPKMSVVKAVARALECPIAYLIDGSGENVSETMSDSERELVRNYRLLDDYGRELVDTVMRMEADRTEAGEKLRKSAVILQRDGERHRVIPLFDMPVAAGRGAFLDSDASEDLKIKVTRTSSQADFALRITGNSMEPEFHEGDLLLVKKQSELEQGELGIFIGDGAGYFKRFMGDVLHSLNPEYKDIPISSFSDFRCCGKVIGRTRI